VCEDAHHTAYHAPGSTLWNLRARYNEVEDEVGWGEWILSRAPLGGEGTKTWSYEQAPMETLTEKSPFLQTF
jgi:hypothetical protein